MNTEQKRAYAKAYYQANKEKWKSPNLIARAKTRRSKRREQENARARKRYAAEPEKHRAYASDYAKANPQQRRDTWNRWYEKNKDHRDEYAAAYRAANRGYWEERYQLMKDHQRELARLWRKNNPETAKGTATRRRARLKDGRSPGVTLPEWLDVLAANGHKCAYCGGNKNGKRLERDHVLPLFLGGLDEPSNVVPACRSCNASKGGKPLQEWLKRRGITL